MEIPSTDIELRLLNNEGKLENIRLNGNSIANLDTNSVEKGKIDLTKFKVKTKDGNIGSFIEIHGFSVNIGRGNSKTWIDFELQKKMCYCLPNKNNVSSLVDPLSIKLTGGYSKLYLTNDGLKLTIPIAEERTFQSKKDPDRYVYY